MTAIQTSHGPEFRVAGIAARFAARLAALAARAFGRLSAISSQATHWRSLDERLLRDIGVFPLDAEIARLSTRMGVAETDDRRYGRYGAPRLERRPVPATVQEWVLPQRRVNRLVARRADREE